EEPARGGRGSGVGDREGTYPTITYPFPHRGGKGLLSGSVLATPAPPCCQHQSHELGTRPLSRPLPPLWGGGRGRGGGPSPITRPPRSCQSGTSRAPSGTSGR